MKNILIVFLLAFSMCNSNHTPVTPANEFAGKFTGNHSGVSSTADFLVRDNQLKGTIVMGGNSVTVNGAVSGTSAAGKISEGEKEYQFTGIIAGNELRLTITNPEQVNEKADLVMQREKSTSSPLPNPVPADVKGKERNEALIGLWKNTEVLSSGSGGNYMSFSTEFFMEFSEDGTARKWTGRSAGSGTDRESDEANAQRGEWYTEDKTLYLVDPVTKQKATTFFSVSESDLLLSDGNSKKKIFERVR